MLSATRIRSIGIAVLAAACAVAGAAHAAPPPPDVPAAIYTDPAEDAAVPASSEAVQFRSHGALLNAQVYRPPGAGPHPTAVIFHGLPGNEQNLDLAQALRRAGWTTVTFHYTGSWGSGGRFTLRAGVEDGAELLAYLRVPAQAAAWGVDPATLLLIGHSYGGYVAARAASAVPGVVGVVLVAPWDISMAARTWLALAPAARIPAATAAFDDVDGRLAGANAVTLAREVLDHGAGLDLARLAQPLRALPLLVITATRDSSEAQAAELLAELRRLGTPHLTSAVMQTDHAFNTHRIALETAVLRWAAALPGAPKP